MVYLCPKSLNEVIEFLFAAVAKIILHSIHKLTNL